MAHFRPHLLHLSLPPAANAAWPVLHEGDGGREVHALHVALQQAGYYPSGGRTQAGSQAQRRAEQEALAG